MAQRAAASNKAQVIKAQVIRNGRSQSVRLPSAIRFNSDEVYVRQDAKSGVVTLSERPARPTWEEIFRAFDEAGAQDFEIAREKSLPRDVEF